MALSCAFFLLSYVCRSSYASSYSFTEEPITGRSRTSSVICVTQHCGAVQGTFPIKAEGVSIHLLSQTNGMIVLFTDMTPSQQFAASHLAKAVGGKVKWQPTNASWVRPC